MRLWHLDDPGQPAELGTHDDAVNAVAAGPDGRWVVTGGNDQRVRLWHLDDPGQPAELGTHDDAVNAVAAGPDDVSRAPREIIPTRPAPPPHDAGVPGTAVSVVPAAGTAGTGRRATSMTTRSPAPTTPRTLPAMTSAGALAATAMTVGQFVETPYEADSSTWSLAFAEGGGPGALALVLTFAALGAGVVGALLHRWSATPTRTGARALGLAVAGALSVPVFWTGLPVVLASGATVLAIRDRHQASPWSASGRAALALGVALLALAGYLAVVG